MAICDECQCGQDDGWANPIKKPTNWMSNDEFILAAVGKNTQIAFVPDLHQCTYTSLSSAVVPGLHLQGFGL